MPDTLPTCFSSAWKLKVKMRSSYSRLQMMDMGRDPVQWCVHNLGMVILEGHVALRGSHPLDDQPLAS